MRKLRNKLDGSRLFYYVFVFGLEFFCCILIIFVFFLLQDNIGQPDLLQVFDVPTLLDAINNFNIGLIFAMFLAIFVSDSSVSIKDARKHPAYEQPLMIVIVNSFMMCVLSALRGLSDGSWWLVLCAAMCSLLFLFVNIGFMRQLVRISCGFIDEPKR